MFEKMQADGISFALKNGGLKIDGDKLTVEKWIPFIRENKHQIISELENIPQGATQGALLSSEAKQLAIETEPQSRAPNAKIFYPDELYRLTRAVLDEGKKLPLSSQRSIELGKALDKVVSLEWAGDVAGAAAILKVVVK